MTIGSDTSFQHKTSPPLYKQCTDTVEHKYTRATTFINNQLKINKTNKKQKTKTKNKKQKNKAQNKTKQNKQEF